MRPRIYLQRPAWKHAECRFGLDEDGGGRRLNEGRPAKAAYRWHAVEAPNVRFDSIAIRQLNDAGRGGRGFIVECRRRKRWGDQTAASSRMPALKLNDRVVVGNREDVPVLPMKVRTQRGKVVGGLDSRAWELNVELPHLVRIAGFDRKGDVTA